MSMGKNIAKYRKIKGYTQEELGAKLGVTNQAVSKWESDVSMPDIMLLSAIADALSVTLNDLYGLKNDENDMYVTADDFPIEAYLHIFRYFRKQCRVNFSNMDRSSEEAGFRAWVEQTESGDMLGCVSNKAGGVVIDNAVAFAETSYGTKDSEQIFLSSMLGSALRDLASTNARKVLAYEYKCSYEHKIESNPEFTLKELAEGCGLSEEDTLDAIKKLIDLKCNLLLGEEDDCEKFVFLKSSALYALAIFHIAKMMISEHSWLVVRDPALISDYAFEKVKPD